MHAFMYTHTDAHAYLEIFNGILIVDIVELRFVDMKGSRSREAVQAC